MQDTQEMAYAFYNGTGETKMLARVPPSWELHLLPDLAFTRSGWGRKVRGVGGRYSEVRGGVRERRVHVPATEPVLLDALVERFHDWTRRQLVVVARGLPVGLPVKAELYLDHAPSAPSTAARLQRVWRRRMDRLAAHPASGVVRWSQAQQAHALAQRQAAAESAKREAVADACAKLVEMLGSLPADARERVLVYVGQAVRTAGVGHLGVVATEECTRYVHKLVLGVLEGVETPAVQAARTRASGGAC